MVGYLKKKIYFCMKAHLSEDWGSLLPTIVDNYNMTPNRFIGNLRPIDVISREDGPTIRAAIKKMASPHSQPPSEPHFDHVAKAENTTTEKELQVGTFVMLDKKRSSFQKASDYQVGYYTCFYLCFLAKMYRTFYSFL